MLEDFGEGRPYRGYEPGVFPGTGAFGYAPSPYPEQGGFGRDYNTPSGYRPEESAFGSNGGEYGRAWPDRGYEPSDPRHHERSWSDRAKDEVRSWAGDEDAERRRQIDEARSHYRRRPKGYTRSDDRIREDVSDRLTDDWLVDASDIEVTVASGDVTLAGTMDSRDAKRRAEDCAEGVSGVRNVQNNLRVQQPGTIGAAAAASSRTTR